MFDPWTSTREQRDRRTVTLRSTDRARAAVEEFFAESETALADYTEEQLVFVRPFVDRFAGVLPGPADPG